MKEKIIKVMDPREVTYDESHYAILNEKRMLAKKIMGLMYGSPFLHGSVARGDVHQKSDIDIIFTTPVETFLVEMPILDSGLQITTRELVMANPNSIPKAHIGLENDISITVPLFKPSRNEEEFYRFGGILPIDELCNDVRVCGVSKKLIYIEPTKNGHIEQSILGREIEVSKKLDIHQETVNERIRVLSRRDRIGRTGVYLKTDIEPESSFEFTFKFLSDRDPVLRRHLKIRKR